MNTHKTDRCGQKMTGWKSWNRRFTARLTIARSQARVALQNRSLGVRGGISCGCLHQVSGCRSIWLLCLFACLCRLFPAGVRKFPHTKELCPVRGNLVRKTGINASFLVTPASGPDYYL